MCAAIPQLHQLKNWHRLTADTTDLRGLKLEGVSVHPTNGRVTKIELACKRLEGSISSIRFGDLAALHVLRLNNNRLGGDLPDMLGGPNCCPLLVSHSLSRPRSNAAGACDHSRRLV